MTFISKFPEACRHLDLDLVRRTLTRHRLDISAAAKELGVNRTDLRRLTWHDPKLLGEALDACGLYVIRCNSRMIEGLSSPRQQVRDRAAEQIFASPMAYGHPLAAALTSAPRSKVKSTKPPSKFILEMNRRRASQRSHLLDKPL